MMPEFWCNDHSTLIIMATKTKQTLPERLSVLSELKDGRCATLILPLVGLDSTITSRISKFYRTFFAIDGATGEDVCINKDAFHIWSAMREHIKFYNDSRMANRTLVVYGTVTGTDDVKLIDFILEDNPKLVGIFTLQPGRGVCWKVGTYHRLHEVIAALKA